ncbi:MAG: hypothetical protein GY791_09130 [Alphaproteobacteria bacterium]|nr:hypothetical protein [Alphaproteobacteria bacterium]
MQLRDPSLVMRLDRLGSFHQTRLSFMRALMRRVKRERWRFERPVWRIDENGVGVAVYTAQAPHHVYSLIAYGHELPPELRTDRVIAEAWDSTYALFDGIPSEADIERLAHNVPKQEAGRYLSSELVLSRANKSVRLFEHVVSRLAEGRQPDVEQVEAVGYLMRTTAVYGNGKFGIADRDVIAARPEVAGPFRAEMLTVWLIRNFTVDLAEHIARERGGSQAVALDPAIRRRLGVGNSTGLGMAPFLVNHPTLINSWIEARETALARVRSLVEATNDATAVFTATLARARHLAEEWQTGDARQADRIIALQADLTALAAHVDAGALSAVQPWDSLYRWAEENLSLEGQEMTVTLLIEPHADLVDDLTVRMSVDEEAAFPIGGSISVGEMKSLVAHDYAWALSIDFDLPHESARFWYVSEEKLEPRLGERDLEAGSELEEPLAIARDMRRFHDALGAFDRNEKLAAFLLAHPQYRHLARRAQIVGAHPYAEIRDNVISADLRAIDLLRCKLSFFGATKFDPRSDRWVRITMYQDAPFPDEIDRVAADDWAYPMAAAR